MTPTLTDQNGKLTLALSLSPLTLSLIHVQTLLDILYISQYIAVRSTLHTLAPPIQSSPPFSQYLDDVPLFLWPFTFPLILTSPVFGVFLFVRNNLIAFK